MYRYLDGRVIELGEGERLIVWAMRRWLAAARERQCPLQPIGAMFAARRILTGLAPFHSAMLLLTRQARQTLTFGPMRCRRIADAEALLLSMTCGVLSQPPGRTAATASLIVGEANSAPLVEALAGVAAAFAEAGLAAP